MPKYQTTVNAFEALRNNHFKMTTEDVLNMAATNGAGGAGGGEMLDATRTVRMRGLPYNCRVQQIKEFFGGENTVLYCFVVATNCHRRAHR